ncbi:unnamed protein product [Schistocephalus solidus]|uniref:Transposase n=1 Tax=Schistocephalus solidus TaxID=70667 RepID=A0A183TDY2_SCHSO|nr:unnamed protein product [Schistocephalus solidus]
MYSKFVRKQYVPLKMALDMARGYEATEVAQRKLASDHIGSVSQPIPADRRSSPYQSVVTRCPRLAVPIVADLAGGPSIATKIPQFVLK